MKKIILGVGFVFLAGCSSQVLYDCNDQEQRIWKEVIEPENHCETDSDCVAVYKPCPFGCGFLVNENANFEKIDMAVDGYLQHCPSCRADCRLAIDQKDIECKKDRTCGVKEFGDQQKDAEQEAQSEEREGAKSIPSQTKINTLLDDEFEKHLTSSDLMDHELLKKVFPKVKFFVQTSRMTMPPSKRIIAELDGLTYNLPFQFNDLFRKIEDSSNVTIEDRLQLFALLTFEFKKNIESCKKISPTEFKNYLFNYEVVLKGDFKLLFAFYHDEIFRIEKFLNDTYMGPIPLNVPPHSIRNGIPKTKES